MTRLSRAEKTRENYARRMASRQGLTLARCRTRDPLALEFGQYSLLFAGHPVPLNDAGALYAPLAEVERWLAAGHGRALVRERMARARARAEERASRSAV